MLGMRFHNLLIQGCLAFTLVYSNISFAEIYKWVDDQGVVHYADSKPADVKTDVEEFFISPIDIANDGTVTSAGEDVSLSSEELDQSNDQPPSDSTSFSLDQLISTITGTINDIILKISLNIKKLTHGVNTSDLTQSDTISNENMDAILEAIEQDREQEKEKAELANKKPDVEIFTTPTCGYCKKAMAYMDMNGVKYKETDVARNAAAALRQKSLGGGRGVPFAVINGHKIRGWNQKAYQNALGL